MEKAEDDALDGEQWVCGGELDPSDFTDRKSDDEEGFIGPICVDSDTFTFVSEVDHSIKVNVCQEREKGLSFQIWPSSLFLSEYAIRMDRQQPGIWKGKRVLELGCGCGLVGLVWAALGAEVLLTDLPDVMALVQRNIDLNTDLLAPPPAPAPAPPACGAPQQQQQPQSRVGSASACPLVWGQLPLDGGALGPWARPDVVVAADVVYHRELFDLLLGTLGALGGPGTVLLLAHVRRWKSDKRFFGRLQRMFSVEDVTHCMEAAGAEGEGQGGQEGSKAQGEAGGADQQVEGQRRGEHGSSSHAKGERRIFRCVKKQSK